MDSPCGLVVNVYALRSGDRVALVDTGFSHTADQVAEGLAELDLSPGDVTDVLYTHTHVDHMGGGVALAGRWRPAEWTWEGSEPAFGDWYAHAERARTPEGWPVGPVDASRADDPLVVQMRSKPRNPLRVAGDGRLADPRGVAFGEVVEVGELSFTCVDARGHDPFHCAWFEADRGWLFSGDVVLAVPTPLVARTGDCPGTWLGTLERWERELDVSWLLPGHGLPTRLFGPSLARSRASLARVYDAVSRRLGSGEVVDLLSLTRRVLPRDPSRYAARSSAVMSTLETLLMTLQRMGVVERVSGDRWRRVSEVPPMEALVRA